VLGISLAALGTITLLRRGRNGQAGAVTHEERDDWRMPPLELIQRPVMSIGRRTGLTVLRGYLFIAAAMVIAKTFGLAG
jgi:hypothetical protein